MSVSCTTLRSGSPTLNTACVASTYGSLIYRFQIEIKPDVANYEAQHVKLLYKYYDFDSEFVAQMKDYIAVKARSYTLNKSAVILYRPQTSEHAYKVITDDNFGEGFIPDIETTRDTLSILVSQKTGYMGLRYTVEDDYTIKLLNNDSAVLDDLIEFGSILENCSKTYPLKALFSTPEQYYDHYIVIRIQRLETMLGIAAVVLIAVYIIEKDMEASDKHKMNQKVRESVIHNMTELGGTGEVSRRKGAPQEDSGSGFVERSRLVTVSFKGRETEDGFIPMMNNMNR